MLHKEDTLRTPMPGGRLPCGIGIKTWAGLNMPRRPAGEA
jgi:hypothetical protein